MNKQRILADTAVMFLLLFCVACCDPASDDKQALQDMGREKALCETEEKSVPTLSEEMAEAIKMAGGDK